MTSLQQAGLHTLIVIVVIAAVVTLAITGNLSSQAVVLVLAAAGISSTGVAAVTPTATTQPIGQPLAAVQTVGTAAPTT
jgi:hypothetical protein